ncbi:MAG: hypothetical protein M3256_06800 [Actinomycetota bacterium]|nr:hypothetical protein [Actinomycetota bacterium]
MAMTKRIVCLANSRKLNGRCVAGRELIDGTPGEWIRPVSDREHQEVSEYERQFEDGSDPQVLDVIDLPLLDWRPGTYQQENWLLDPDHYWVRTGRVSWNDLDVFTDRVEPLWVNGYSTYHGLNDEIPMELADALESSLVLIRVARVQLSVFAPGEAFGNSKRRVQARVSHRGNDYRLWVTDPVYERAYLAQPDGEYQLGECFMTISLGEPYRGYSHKLIAAIMQPPSNAGVVAG